MRIISIDPGYEKLGIAIIEKELQGREKILFSECFKTDKKLSHEKRLFLAGTEIEKIIEEYAPKYLAIENLFINTNQKTAMKVSEMRGVILYLAEKNNLEVAEYTPPQIKLAVTGSGNADKKAIIKMLPMLVKIEKIIKEDDEYDAIAVGLTFFAIKKFF